MTVADAGEFGLLARILPRFGTAAATVLGPGDDAAIVAVSDGRVVVSTDVLVEGRHFRQDWSGPYEIGRKAAAQNLADVVAMGALPIALLVGLACPPTTSIAWTEAFADGLRDESAPLGAAVVGGDTSRAGSLFVSVTALGDLRGRAPVTRAGAQPGDMVAVAGRLGWSAAGYTVLSRGFRTPRVLVAAHQVPTPPYAAGLGAADLGATSMCDVSDGLLADLGHIATASNVRFELSSGAFDVPGQMADAAQALGIDVLRWILTGGEDHALAATFPPGTDLPEPWLLIGSVAECTLTEGPAVLVDGAEWADGGFDHFR